jgi:hypothetical protein
MVIHINCAWCSKYIMYVYIYMYVGSIYICIMHYCYYKCSAQIYEIYKMT